MSLWSRVANVFRGERLNCEIDEELESHLQEAIDGGRDPGESRRAFGSTLRIRDEVRDVNLIPCLDSLRSDAIFGWRQLKMRKVSSAAAILSLALGIAACVAAFRLIDAMLWRPLPVTSPERLYFLSRQGLNWDGKANIDQNCEYPRFLQMRVAVHDRAELLASYGDRVELSFESDQEIEKHICNMSRAGCSSRPDCGLPWAGC